MNIPWQLLREFFETDDGSLPEVELHYPESEKACETFVWLYEQAEAGDATMRACNLWSAREDRPLSWPGSDACRYVASGEAEALHIVICDMQHSGVTIPDLGIFFFGTHFVIDWRMGQEWSPDKVEWFIGLLHQLCQMGGELRVSWWRDAEVEARFRRAMELVRHP